MILDAATWVINFLVAFTVFTLAVPVLMRIRRVLIHRFDDSRKA